MELQAEADAQRRRLNSEIWRTAGVTFLLISAWIKDGPDQEEIARGLGWTREDD